MARSHARRGLKLLLGLSLFGVGIALMVQAGLGLGPWDSLAQGLSLHTGVPIGTVSLLLGIPILMLWVFVGERPGVGTVLNVAWIGPMTNVSLGWLPKPTELPLQFLFMTLGVVIIGLGSGGYLSAGLGAGPRDGLMMGLSRRTGWSIRATRTLIELSVLGLGWALGGAVGLGTLAFAFGIGPVVQMSLRLFKRGG